MPSLANTRSAPYHTRLNLCICVGVCCSVSRQGCSGLLMFGGGLLDSHMYFGNDEVSGEVSACGYGMCSLQTACFSAMVHNTIPKGAPAFTNCNRRSSSQVPFWHLVSMHNTCMSKLTSWVEQALSKVPAPYCISAQYWRAPDQAPCSNTVIQYSTAVNAAKITRFASKCQHITTSPGLRTQSVSQGHDVVVAISGKSGT